MFSSRKFKFPVKNRLGGVLGAGPYRNGLRITSTNYSFLRVLLPRPAKKMGHPWLWAGIKRKVLVYLLRTGDITAYL